MIVGVGCDLVEISRIAKACSREAFVKRVFAPQEIAYCKSRGVQSAASFAARFAAKEAVLKAMGTGWRGGALSDIIITNDELGKPQVQLLGYHADQAREQGITRINISLSHTREQALAYVVMEDDR